MLRPNRADNRLKVLRVIHAHTPVSRSDLPRMTGLAAGTISQITADLVARGLVVESKQEARQAGRPRVYLEIAKNGPLVVGASISMNNSLIATIVDLGGRIQFEMELAFAKPASLGELAASVGRTLSRIIASSGFSTDRIKHVGIGVPGIVDSKRGEVHFMATFDQPPYPFAEVVSSSIGLPVTIEKNIMSMARAEHWHGAAKGHATFTMLHLGLALDSATYRDGLPQTGVHGFAPELGHIRTSGPDTGEQCYCGGYGCATVYASIIGIARRAGELKDLPATVPELEEAGDRFARVLDNACAGDKAALAAFEMAGWHLGQLIAGHVNAADPGLVVVMVPDLRLVELMRNAFDDALKEGVLPGIRKVTEVKFARQQDNWQTLGTAALALEKA